jgi:hypothetical protein
MPSQNVPVQRLNLIIIPPGLFFSWFLIHSGKTLTNGKSHKKKLDGLLTKYDSEIKRYCDLNMQPGVLKG